MLPYIDDYAKTCSRHPSFEAGYRQWLKVVAAWGYDLEEVYQGEKVWSLDTYQAIWA